MLNSQPCLDKQTYANEELNKTVQNTKISQMLMIQEQSDLIAELIKKKSHFRTLHNFSTEVSDFSFESGDRTRGNLNASISSIYLSRNYSKYIDDEYSSEEVLDQIRRHCSHKVFNFVRNRLKNAADNRKQLQLQKQMKYNQQLTERCLKLSQQVGSLKIKLQAANEKLRNQEKKKVTKIQSVNIDKGYVFLKWEKSLLYKQKIQGEMKKSLNKQIKMIEQEREANQKLKKQIEGMLQQLQEDPEEGQIVRQVAKVVRQNIEQQKIKQKVQLMTVKKINEHMDEVFKELKAMINKLN